MANLHYLGHAIWCILYLGSLLRTTFSGPDWDFTCTFRALHETGYTTYKNRCLLGCNNRLSCG